MKETGRLQKAPELYKLAGVWITKLGVTLKICPLNVWQQEACHGHGWSPVSPVNLLIMEGASYPVLQKHEREAVKSHPVPTESPEGKRSYPIPAELTD